MDSKENDVGFPKLGVHMWVSNADRGLRDRSAEIRNRT